jgi:mRNA-degrading endonuclease YafQ of YafQ-DinJ toxin-antitoxin module
VRCSIIYGVLTDYHKLYMYIACVCYLNTGSFVKLMKNVANQCELDDSYHDFRISMKYRGNIPPAVFNDLVIVINIEYARMNIVYQIRIYTTT